MAAVIMGAIINKLPKLVKERSINLSALSRQTGVAYPTILSWAKGEVKTIKLDTLARICDGLHIQDIGEVLEYVPNSNGD